MGAASSAFLATAALGGAYSSAQAQRAQGEFQRSQYELNARYSELQAKDAERRGTLAANRKRLEGRQVQGAQRAALAAQGLDVNSGTAAIVQGETQTLSELDAITIKNNAFREAWGHRVSAITDRSRGRFASMAGRYGARNTLLTGGLQAFAYGADYFGSRSASGSSIETGRTRIVSGGSRSDPSGTT